MVYAFGDWSDEIAEVAVEFMNCLVDIIDPNTSVTTPYDPKTGTGGVTTQTKLYTNVPARAQHIKSGKSVLSSVDWNMYRNYRFQVRLSDVPGLVNKGMQIIPVTGGKDESIVGLICTIEASSNSSHAAVRTFETITPNSKVV